MKTGERIKYLRQKKGITVNKLANIAGISQSYLRDIELGVKTPTVEYLSYICDALEITLSSFFDTEQTTLLETDGEQPVSLESVIKKLTPYQKEKLKDFLNSLNIK